MLSGFRNLAGNSQGEIILVNAAGYELSSSNPDDDWKFMFDEKREIHLKKSIQMNGYQFLGKRSANNKKRSYYCTSPVSLRCNILQENNSHNQQIILGDSNWVYCFSFERNVENSGYFNDNIWSLLSDILRKIGYILYSSVFFLVS